MRRNRLGSVGGTPETVRVRAWKSRNSSAGYTLIEAMVAMLLFLVIFLSALLLIDGFQVLAWNLSLAREKEENLTTAPLLLARWITPAGNNRYTASWVGVSGDADRLDLCADIDGKGGFPDGTLGQSYESISIRRNGGELQIKSDKGSFQPTLRNVGAVKFQTGKLPLLEVTLASAIDRPLIRWKQTPAEDENTLSFYLWNYRQNLFVEAP